MVGMHKKINFPSYKRMHQTPLRQVPHKVCVDFSIFWHGNKSNLKLHLE